MAVECIDSRRQDPLTFKCRYSRGDLHFKYAPRSRYAASPCKIRVYIYISDAHVHTDKDVWELGRDGGRRAVLPQAASMSTPHFINARSKRRYFHTATSHSNPAVFAYSLRTNPRPGRCVTGSRIHNRKLAAISNQAASEAWVRRIPFPRPGTPHLSSLGDRVQSF